jgi:serine-type D-Ala-D-Ala carboxypeptidase/endopeptidase
MDQRIWTFLAATVCALGLAAPPAKAAQPSAFPDDAGLLALIRARVEEGRAAGIVLGVIDADGSTRIVSYGDPGAGARPLGGDSVFEIASITKVFTATVLADMAAKGEIRLDAPVQDYAPDALVMPQRNGKQITLAHLSSHRSGLPRVPGNLPRADPSNPYADYTVDQLHAFVSSYVLTRDPGETFEYSNVGAGLLGHVLADRSGVSYEELVRGRVLEPLGMSMTAISLTPPMRAALVKGHDRSGNVTANWDSPTLAGAGALRSNMNDMLKFLDANVGAPRNELERAMRTAHVPRMSAGSAAQIGLNWISQVTPGGVTVVWHNGATGGYSSFIGFDAEREIGVVLLANQTGVNDDIAKHLLDPMVQITVPPTSANQ